MDEQVSLPVSGYTPPEILGQTSLLPAIPETRFPSHIIVSKEADRTDLWVSIVFCSAIV